MNNQSPDEIRVFSEAGNQEKNGRRVDLPLLTRLLEISSQMSAFEDIDQLVGFFVNKIAELFRVSRVSFMLLDRINKELSVKASCGLSSSANKVRIKLGQMFVGWVAQEGKPLLVRDIEAEYPNILRERISRYKTKSFIIVPITVKAGVIGILSLTDKKDSTVFNEGDLAIINLVSHCFAFHIESIRLLQKNAELAIIDNLTGLFNHRYFQEHLLEEIYHAERYRQPLALLMLDIDDFRLYNQNFGYSGGDSALKQIAGIIKVNIRRVDAAVRYGPEEFMMILPNTKLKQATVVGDRIRDAIDYSVFTEDRSSSFGMTKLTGSIGVADYKVGLTKEGFINNVTSALSRAKQQGKNRICVFK
ncbi:diguanylate cyclase [Candidatus Omnitrophota bacterium]